MILGSSWRILTSGLEEGRLSGRGFGDLGFGGNCYDD